MERIEKQLQDEMLKFLGIRPVNLFIFELDYITKFEDLSLNGNAARILFMDQHHSQTMALLHPPNDDSNDIRYFFEFFLVEIRFLLAVVSSRNPAKDFDLNEFDDRRKNLQLFMLEKMPWIGDIFFLVLAKSP